MNPKRLSHLLLVLPLFVASFATHAQVMPAQVTKGLAEYDLGYTKEAAADLEPQARQGDTRSAIVLGILRVTGNGVAKDGTAALQWFQQAATAGDTAAMYNIGCMYHKGDGVAQDAQQAVQWLTKAAEAGDAESALELGNFYRLGHGVAQDQALAESLERNARANGASWRGCAYLRPSHAKDEDVRQARLLLLERKAEAGDARAQLQLGDAYLHGFGVTKDEARAETLLRSAAEQEEPDAQWIVAMMFSKSRDESRRWLERGAENWDIDAMGFAAMFANDPIKSYMYCELRAIGKKADVARPVPDCRNYGAPLGKPPVALSDEQVQDGEDAVNKFLRRHPRPDGAEHRTHISDLH